MGAVFVKWGAWRWELDFCDLMAGCLWECCSQGGKERLDGDVRVDFAFDLVIISRCHLEGFPCLQDTDASKGEDLPQHRTD